VGRDIKIISFQEAAASFILPVCSWENPDECKENNYEALNMLLMREALCSGERKAFSNN